VVEALAPAPPDNAKVRLSFQAPADMMPDDFSNPHRILTRLLRRVDGVSRWNGLGLDNDVGRDLAKALAGYEFDIGMLQAGRHLGPNAKRQKRRKQVMTGSFIVRGDIAAIWPMLVIGERCHLGRGAVEGLGAFRIS
jgi:hypothetical protein